MFGAIAGDVIGSMYEWIGTKSPDFELFVGDTTFTDDTVLTVAVAKALLDDLDYAETFRDFCGRYPGRGYGGMFARWLQTPGAGPYQSWGNGSAMRVSPVGFARDSVQDVLEEARRTASVTHDHPEGIKGAQATALAIFLARTGVAKNDIRREIEDRFEYDLGRTVAEMRPTYEFNESCQETVPESIICFLESGDYESAIRLAVSMGGDADTMGSIAGGIAQAFYGEIPPAITVEVERRLPEEFRKTVERFESSFGVVRSA
jgi:ADP-ribosyl-[dinitrogen reductase] hydrolase